MTYTNIIPEAEQMTWEEALKCADEEATSYAKYRHALAKRIQMTEPKPVDPVIAVMDVIGWAFGPEDCLKFYAELGKRGLRIGPIDGEEG